MTTDPSTSTSGSAKAADEALNAMTLHEKCGVEPHLAVTLATSGVVPEPRLRAELEEEISQ